MDKGDRDEIVAKIADAMSLLRVAMQLAQDNKEHRLVADLATVIADADDIRAELKQ